MKLEETTFDLIEIGDECIFRNEFGICVHAIKLNFEQIIRKATNETAYTGRFHKVYKITNPFTKLSSPENSKRLKQQLLQWLIDRLQRLLLKLRNVQRRLQYQCQQK